MPLRVRDGLAVWLRSLDAASVSDERAEIVAEDAGGRVVGRIAYRRVYGLRAVLTLAVDDTFWQCGLPEALIASIGPVAATGGISRFLMRFPASDERLLGMLVESFAARCTLDGRDADVELDAAPRSG